MHAKKLKKQSTLEAFKRTGPVSSKVRLALSLLESTDPTERELGLNSLDRNQDALKFTAVLSDSAETCIAAVQQLHDLKALAFVAENSEDKHVKQAANSRIDLQIPRVHPDALREAAEDAPYTFLRTAAVAELEQRGETGHLIYISIASEYEDTKKLAMGIIKARRRVSR